MRAGSAVRKIEARFRRATAKHLSTQQKNVPWFPNIRMFPHCDPRIVNNQPSARDHVSDAFRCGWRAGLLSCPGLEHEKLHRGGEVKERSHPEPRAAPYSEHGSAGEHRTFPAVSTMAHRTSRGLGRPGREPHPQNPDRHSVEPKSGSWVIANRVQIGGICRHGSAKSEPCRSPPE